MFGYLIKQASLRMMVLFFSLLYINFFNAQELKTDSNDFSLDFMDKIFRQKPDENFYEYNIGSWKTLIQDYKFDYPGLPDLAWKTRSTLEAFFLLYKLSSNNKSADFHIMLTDDLIKTRDDKRGIIAWNGRIYKCWSSGNRYNYGYYNLKDKRGKIIGIFEFKDAKIDQCYISLMKSKTYPNNFDIVINNLRNGKIFKLENTNLFNLEEDVKKIEWNSYVSNNIKNRVVNYVSKNYNINSKIELEEIQMERINSYYVPSIDVNAIHINSLINSYLILKERKELRKLKKYHKYIEESIEANTKLYLKENERECYFSYPKDAKTFMGGGIVYPFNKQFSYVAMLSRWYKITGDDFIYKIINKWKNYFLSKVEKSNHGLVWRYWDDPTSTITRYETQNYGSHDIKYLMTIYENCDIFSKGDIIKLTKAIKENLITCNPNKVRTKTAFDFKWSSDQLPNINYLALGGGWNDLFECYKWHVDINSLYWADRVAIIYYFKKISE
ncbi:hypothetical protein [Flavivirga sp. 57AJ16]|uniref:hypothetical protein n=1 Tax=Flavivirga sp. 57AJ16 TaxID=3025307 RepID=UPI0023662634|nr:hypothetical protein [Flavivirga sp. 57AJ16]MDD7885923.1 hypothetical protein [Flavivirga sp. 57AJ16]